MTSICRLCLNCSSEAHEDISTIDQSHLQSILPEIETNLIKSTLVCTNCIRILETAYSFKCICLETEKLIKSYLKTYDNGNLVDLTLEDVLKEQVTRKNAEDGLPDCQNEEAISNFGDEENYYCLLCKRGFKNKSTLRVHKARHKAKPQCTVCKRFCYDNYGLKKHMKIHETYIVGANKEIGDLDHSKSLDCLQCNLCGKEYKSQEIYLKHVDTHASKPSCHVCKKTFFNNASLRRHMWLIHKITSEENKITKVKPYSCNICNKTYRCRSSLSEHKVLHFISIECRICKKTLFNKGSLRRHMVQMHLIKNNKHQNKSQAKSKILDSTAKLKNVEFLINNESQIIATSDLEPNEKFELESKFNKDCSIALESDFVKSKTVGLKSNTDSKINLSEIKIDSKINTESKCIKEPNTNQKDLDDLENIFCEVCRRSACKCKNEKRTCGKCKRNFYNEKSFRQHQLFHAGVEKYFCDVCKKGFITKLYLKRHIRFNHLGMCRTKKEPSMCTCETCGITVRNKSSLTQHKRIHTGERPYKCDCCEKSFIQSSCLSTHKKTVHGSERPFTCEYCSKSFNVKGSLNKHILAIHKADEVEKKYICSFCGKRYRIQSQLNNHVIWHKNDRKFCCDVCGKAFNCKYSVKKHRVTHFPAEAFRCEMCGKGFHENYTLKTHRKVHLKIQ